MHFAIQKGVQVSKSKTIWFKHNDMHDLEQKIVKAMDEQQKASYVNFVLCF